MVLSDAYGSTFNTRYGSRVITTVKAKSENIRFLNMNIINFVKKCVQNDKKLVRNLTRPIYYMIMRRQYYELSPIRQKMMTHAYKDKEEMLRQGGSQGQEQKKGTWKWVFHVKQEKPRVYSRYWRYVKKDKKQFE